MTLAQAQAAVVRARDAMWLRGLREAYCGACHQPLLETRRLPKEACGACRPVRLIARVYSTPATTPIGRARRVR